MEDSGIMKNAVCMCVTESTDCPSQYMTWKNRPESWKEHQWLLQRTFFIFSNRCLCLVQVAGRKNLRLLREGSVSRKSVLRHIRKVLMYSFSKTGTDISKKTWCRKRQWAIGGHVLYFKYALMSWCPLLSLAFCSRYPYVTSLCSDPDRSFPVLQMTAGFD